jgi:hypothetical protein
VWQIRARQLIQRQQAQQRVKLSQVVTEEAMPIFSTIHSAFAVWRLSV